MYLRVQHRLRDLLGLSSPFSSVSARGVGKSLCLLVWMRRCQHLHATACASALSLRQCVRTLGRGCSQFRCLVGGEGRGSSPSPLLNGGVAVPWQGLGVAGWTRVLGVWCRFVSAAWFSCVTLKQVLHVYQ